jgi:hypothetical protein
LDLEHRERILSARPPRFWTVSTPKEHLSQVGKVIYGESPEGKLWIQERYDELDQGRLKSLVEALRDRASQYKEAGECVRHISKNRCRMRYPKFHQRGF